jgi:hypothetical protein
LYASALYFSVEKSNSAPVVKAIVSVKLKLTFAPIVRSEPTPFVAI